MKDDELLEQRLRECGSRDHKDVLLNSVDLASRVRALRSKRMHRHRAIVASSVLLFVGFGLYFPTSRSERTPEPDLPQPIVFNGSAPGTGMVDPNYELSKRMDTLRAEIEQAQQQTELLLLNIRVHQAIAKADRLVRESNHRTLREERAAQWLIATFRDMSVDGTH